MKKSVVRKQIQTRCIRQLRTAFFQTIHIAIVRLCVIASILLVFRQEEEVCACEQASMDGVSASSVEPVYPVLIRSEHAPLLRVVVEVEQGTNVRV
ncbi:MAG: hypothetical protein NTX02_03435, partial [Planctomycetia bacterium]|nr:hypothetical protein [Planctomycetia bacterium]